ncbi:MAG TPA: M28 family peptidase [Candidatus Krumholzibacterium sp.]|nr:M28 family peptidase [Candidatus Krumholzibacterium sp.]
MSEASRKCGTVRCFVPAFLLLTLIVSCSPDSPPVFSGEEAFVFLEEQCEIGFRYPGSPGHRKLQRYLARRLEEYGANLSLQPFTGVMSTGDTLTGVVNIIGNYNLDARKRIMLAAHFDTRPVSDMDPDPANRSMPVTGANDGASGVAVLLQIAKILQQHEPPVGVDIVLFDAEDSGDAGRPQDFALGSRHFSLSLKGYRPFAAIVLDMIGDRDLEIPMEGYSAAASAGLLEEIFTIAERLGIEQFKREQGVVIADDHLPLIQAGIQAVDLIDFDYPYWHTVQDTPDKCSPESLEAVGRVLIEFIWSQKDR